MQKTNHVNVIFRFFQDMVNVAPIIAIARLPADKYNNVSTRIRRGGFVSVKPMSAEATDQMERLARW